MASRRFPVKQKPSRSRPKPGPVDPAEIERAEIAANQKALEHLGTHISYSDLEKAARFATPGSIRALQMHLDWYGDRRINDDDPLTWPEARHARAMAIVQHAGILSLTAAANKKDRDKTLRVAAMMAGVHGDAVNDAETILEEAIDELDLYLMSIGARFPGLESAAGKAGAA